MDNQKNLKQITDLSLRGFIKKFSAEFFYVDHRIRRTFSMLLCKPGYLTTSYFQVSDEKFIQPLKLYFTINFIFFLLAPQLSTSQFQVFNFNLKTLTSSNQTYQKIVQGQQQARQLSSEIYVERFNAHIKYNQPAFVFLLIPVFALILNLVQIRKKYYFVQHLIFSTHFVSFFLLSVLIILVLYRISTYLLKLFSLSTGLVTIFLFVAVFVGLLIYLLIGLRSFYNEKWFPSIFKGFILFFGFLSTMGLYIQFLFFYTILALKLSS